jgi:hypothetical protein
MNLSTAVRRAKLRKLAETEGFESVHKMLEAATFDSVSPGICVQEGCDYTTEVEPDQTEGWCEACGRGSVASALILAGFI